ELKQSLMAQNELDGPVFKIRNDPRVTRVGQILRKTSIDELPQLCNYLIGDMSLVGPRPALPSEVLQWEKWQYRRLLVEQGCTCIWQVSGRNNLSFIEWMRLDMEYVYNWSLWMDIRLIILTIWVMLTGKGAY
ncbi:MAG: sugar transferase, partial [Proteobacteria bacterium]|nr:sugar transferase [Pseudomonadota bacterium]